MEAVIQTTNQTSEKNAIETLLSNLDKGIDDMESDRVHTADEAFKIIRERLQQDFSRKE